MSVSGPTITWSTLNWSLVKSRQSPRVSEVSQRVHVFYSILSLSIFLRIIWSIETLVNCSDDECTVQQLDSGCPESPIPDGDVWFDPQDARPHERRTGIGERFQDMAQHLGSVQPLRSQRAGHAEPAYGPPGRLRERQSQLGQGQKHQKGRGKSLFSNFSN